MVTTVKHLKLVLDRLTSNGKWLVSGANIEDILPTDKIILQRNYSARLLLQQIKHCSLNNNLPGFEK